MSRRQDYIARIRYQNELPPPPCPPKLLEIPIKVSKLASATYLSDVLRRHKALNLDVDSDLGMPLNMAMVPGIFDRGDESGVYPDAAGADGMVADLDPEDQELISRSSVTSGTISAIGAAGALGANGIATSKSQPGVSFLRRTEYISSEAVKQTNTGAQKRKFQAEILKPEDQLAAVEATFDACQKDLSEIRHPRKKHLKAVESYPVFPDIKMFDLSYLSVKLIGSASLRGHKKLSTTTGEMPALNYDALSTSIFRRNAVGTDEWMSLYTTSDEETAHKLRAQMDSMEETLADEDAQYEFSRIQDNDIELVVPDTPFEEIAISVSDNGQALYVPIAGRANLKRRRVMKLKRDLVAENSFDRIELKLRDITPRETIERDNIRSEFDSVVYAAKEQVDEADAEEEQVADDLDEHIE